MNEEQRALAEALQGILENPRTNVESDLVDGGFLHIGIAAEHGGVGGGLQDAALVWKAAARYHSILPVAETWLAAHALAAAQAEIPAGMVVFGCGSIADDGSGRVAGLLSSESASTAVVVDPRGALVRIPLVSIDGSRVTDLTGQSRISGHFSAGAGTLRILDPQTGGQITDLATLVRLVQMAELAERITATTIEHTRTRVQFGRSLSALQSVQQSVAVMMGETELMRASADAALAAADADLAGAHLAIAAGKLNANLGCERVSLLAHQLHGALGTTHEYGLASLTLRVRMWRDEFGSDLSLSRHLADSVVGEGMWEALTAD